MLPVFDFPWLESDALLRANHWTVKDRPGYAAKNHGSNAIRLLAPHVLRVETLNSLQSLWSSSGGGRSANHHPRGLSPILCCELTIGQ